MWLREFRSRNLKVPGGEAGDLVNVPVEEGVRLRVGDVEQLAGLGHVAGDPLVHRHADLVVAATLQGRKVYYIVILYWNL